MYRDDRGRQQREQDEILVSNLLSIIDAKLSNVASKHQSRMVAEIAVEALRGDREYRDTSLMVGMMAALQRFYRDDNDYYGQMERWTLAIFYTVTKTPGREMYEDDHVYMDEFSFMLRDNRTSEADIEFFADLARAMLIDAMGSSRATSRAHQSRDRGYAEQSYSSTISRYGQQTSYYRPTEPPRESSNEFCGVYVGPSQTNPPKVITVDPPPEQHHTPNMKYAQQGVFIPTDDIPVAPAFEWTNETLTITSDGVPIVKIVSGDINMNKVAHELALNIGATRLPSKEDMEKVRGTLFVQTNSEKQDEAGNLISDELGNGKETVLRITNQNTSPIIGNSLSAIPSVIHPMLMGKMNTNIPVADGTVQLFDLLIINPVIDSMARRDELQHHISLLNNCKSWIELWDMLDFSRTYLKQIFAGVSTEGIDEEYVIDSPELLEQVDAMATDYYSEVLRMQLPYAPMKVATFSEGYKAISEHFDKVGYKDHLEILEASFKNFKKWALDCIDVTSEMYEFYTAQASRYYTTHGISAEADIHAELAENQNVLSPITFVSPYLVIGINATFAQLNIQLEKGVGGIYSTEYTVMYNFFNGILQKEALMDNGTNKRLFMVTKDRKILAVAKSRVNNRCIVIRKVDI